ncbi:hypothetical protein LNP17_09515 [Klebsiella variicola subsp. variicola]|nr:hypothetical protein [Klebsiella variicola subsp. variicola]
MTLLFMGLVIAVLGMVEETRVALLAGLVWLGLLTVVWYARVRKTALAGGHGTVGQSPRWRCAYRGYKWH